jgi:hypothetical protein
MRSHAATPRRPGSYTGIVPERTNAAWLPAAVLVAIGLSLGGYLIGSGFRHFRSSDRYVTVKGIAEQEVKADLALWPLRVTATSNSLAEAQARVAKDAATVRRFFESGGIPAGAIQVQNVEATDLLTQTYRQGAPPSRYIVSQTLMVRSGDVDRIAALAERVGEIVAAGVVTSAEGGPQGPFYLFTRLNDIKPAMIAEATRNARAAAEQFAADSGSSLGPIRQASQGLFQILPRDAAPGQSEEKQVLKTVRVVSTVVYLLTR